MTLMLMVGLSPDKTLLGMDKDGSADFGTLSPNYLGNTMTLVTAAHSDGTNFTLKTAEKIDGKDNFTITTASGATADLVWDAAKGYVGAVGTLDAVLKSHYDGVLQLQFAETATSPNATKPKTTTPKPKTTPKPATAPKATTPTTP